MTLDEIIAHGETKNVEFKGSLPEKSERYMKSIVAFANTQGGYLIVGVEDETLQVIGVDRYSVFSIMDSITNAVSDSCTPQIVPDITLQTVEGKTVVVVYVAPGANRPYYLTSKGKKEGTYVRVAGSSRPADSSKILELEYEGARISWDEQVCIGYEVTEAAVRKLCRDINRYRREMQDDRDAQKLPLVTRRQLINWDVLRMNKGPDNAEQYLATNAFVLLTGAHFHYAKTQCAVFAGIDRGEFLDKQEFEGSLYEQIEHAYAFVLRNIRRSARVEGLVRRERYELPPAAVREMIINAHCHRNYLDTSCIQVALYDDRLEVTSPGSLCYGLTLDEALTGRSKQRNRVIAEVFSQMGLIEAWGTGLRNICRSAEEYSLPEPQFIEMLGTFRVNLFRRNLQHESDPDTGDSTSKHRQNIGKTSVVQHSDIGDLTPEHRQNIGKTSVIQHPGIGDSTLEYRQESNDDFVEEHGSVGKPFNVTQMRILTLLEQNPYMTGSELSEQIGISKRNIEANIRKLKEQGVLIRRGSARKGYWEICGDLRKGKV